MIDKNLEPNHESEPKRSASITLKRITDVVKGRRILCYLCVVIIIGILISDSIWGKKEVELPEALIGVANETYLSIEGEITGLEQKEYSQYIYFTAEGCKWLVYDYEFLDLSIGNHIQVAGTLDLFDVARNPGNFDAQIYYNTRGIVAGIKAESVQITDDSVYPIRNYLYELRLKGVEHIYNILGEEEGSLLVAMVFGEKNGMDDEQKELYQKIGISHIFAISGLHISLISLGVYQMLRRATGSFTVAGVVSGVILVLYIILIGIGTSAIRAGVMFMMRVGADISGRVYDIRTSLSVAALCILLPNTRYLYDGGFLLSFGAILGVIYLVPFWNEVINRSGTPVEKLLQGLGTSLGIQCMILPVLLYFYYEVSPYSVFLNLLVIPIMTVLLGVALVGILISLFWYGAGAVLIQFSGWLLQVIDFLSETTLSLYGSRIIVGQPWWLMIVLYYIGVLGIIGYIHVLKTIEIEGYKKKKIYSMLAILSLGLPVILMIPEDLLNPADLVVTMVDVDQGDGIYISGDGIGNYFIDGGSTGVSEVGKYRIEPYLRSIGVDSLDYVFISHGDTDHLSGIEEMIQRQELGIEIGTIVLCTEEFQDDTLLGLIETAQAYGTEVALIEAGMTITDGDLEITCLAPLESYEGEIGNSSSMILEVAMGELQILFTGDVEGEGEEQLIDILAESEETYSILKVAHHGSNSSTSAEFLEIIQPEIALISAGVDSIYGHPHEETIELLESYGCTIYTTSIDGGVVLSYNSNDDTISIEETIVTK